MLTFEQIKELVELVAAQELQGIEIERSGFRLKISGQEPAPVVTAAAAPPAAAPPAAVAPAAAPTAIAASGAAAPAGRLEAAPAAGDQQAEPEDEGLHKLTSPIVGTFYRAPSPDSEPFVEVGSRVRTGQVLCIVEAMKLMNEIESDIDGVVVEVLPKDAQPVEYGEPLFLIRAD